MRLSRMNLAGFKSFVDPTTIHFPSNLVAVLGPNGCGKSNVIDAVRWVMGESSAKNLRGESLTDVIFNGSSERKPLGQASIELIFENEDGAIGGAYAGYPEVSIRRVLNRDGNSTYFLNNTRCRRRDITDVFLGTGLGPRSYSIIEQGMISRFIEAKPEELRVYLEEAAGISKYKERRKETERRISHTRENLERLGDLREELGNQLAKLKRQSQAAERYKVLKAEQHDIQHQLYALQWQGFNNKFELLNQELQQEEIKLEEFVSNIRRTESDIEVIRESHLEANDNLNEIQRQFYSLGAEVSQLEQTIAHHESRKAELEQDITQCTQLFENTQSKILQDKTKINDVVKQIEIISPNVELATQKASESYTQLQTIETNHNQLQTDWENFSNQSAKNSQQAEVNQAKIQNLEQRLRESHQSQTKLKQEQDQLSFGDLEESITELNTKLITEQEVEEKYKNQINVIREDSKTARETLMSKEKECDTARNNLRKLLGKQASLETLLQAAMGQQDKSGFKQWLEKNNINQNNRLANQLKVNDGWDVAVEAVLGQNLQAFVLNSLEETTGFGELPKNGVNFIAETNRVSALPPIPQNTLLSKIQSNLNLDNQLGNIFLADSLEHAIELTKSCEPNQSAITKNGIWVGPNWLCYAKESNLEDSILYQKQSLENLRGEIQQAEEAITALENQINIHKEKLAEFDNQRDDTQRNLNQQQRILSDIQSQQKIKSARLNHLKHRASQITHELTQLETRVAEDDGQLQTARAAWQEAMDAMTNDADQREELDTARENSKQTLNQSRDVMLKDKESAHQISVQLNSLKAELNTLEKTTEALTAQLTDSEQRQLQLAAQLQEVTAPIENLKNNLSENIEKHANTENHLTDAKQKLSQIDSKMRDLESERTDWQSQHEKLRATLENKRLDLQTQKVEKSHLENLISEGGCERDDLLNNLSEEANIADWQEQLDRIGIKIQRLGAINLAAIEEFETQSERKIYLDTQNDDLEKALATLTDAINKIDKETRISFKETFDKVNGTFKQLFPKLFGGGQAYLELTGEDLLDTGIALMARPPGKRNATVHLLSGGEKALTAVALVFAIFELNPAPFCMLDEVDAPLDDANVARFCNLVKEMSEKVQFIFISHNKLTMEMAHQLMGVTMHEPGVSRIVSVDIEEAAALVEH